MDLKICVAGRICSGKSTLAKRIATHVGCPLVSFGEILKDHLLKNELPATREALQNLGQELISQLGYDGFLQWSIDHSPHIQWKSALVMDGLRHGAIYSRLVEKFPRTVLIYCACSPETQLARLMKRDKVARDEAKRIISHTTEQCVSELEPRAHLLFHSGYSSMKSFLTQLDEFITKL